MGTAIPGVFPISFPIVRYGNSDCVQWTELNLGRRTTVGFGWENQLLAELHLNLKFLLLFMLLLPPNLILS